MLVTSVADNETRQKSAPPILPAPLPWGEKPRQDHRVHDELLPDGSMVLYHTARQQVLTLNPTAALVWACGDGDHDLAAIVAELRGIFPAAPDPERDVLDLLRQLHEHGMLLDETT